MTLPWDIEFIYRVFLVLTRLGAMLFLIPVFNTKSIPMAAKMACFATFSAIVAGLLPPLEMPSNAIGLVVAGIQEILIGLLMGFIIRMAFQVVNFAGELWGMQGYFSRDKTYDPMTGSSSTATERLLFNFSVVAFVAMGLHLKLLGDFVTSYSVAPIGGWMVSQALVNELIFQSSQIFVIGVQIAAPMVAINFVVNMTFAVLGKAAPQMNVFMVSFAVIIFLGLSLLFMILGVVGNTVMHLLTDSAKNLLPVLQLR